MLQVPILELGDILIVPLRSDLTDDQAVALKNEVLGRIQQKEIYGLLIDISVVDLIDSFLGRILNEIVEMSRLMGAKAAITGMSPQVALSMVEFGLVFKDITTTLTLEKGLAWIQQSKTTGA